MPLWRECAELGCTEVTQGTRCDPHEAQRQARRPSRQARGYDRNHDRARGELKAQLPAPCGYGCGRILEQDGDWVAAHLVDGDPDSPRIASCRSCNERAKVRS